MKEVALYLVDSTNVTVREFFSPASSPLKDVDAKVIGPELLNIMKREKLTDQAVVERARDEKSKLHKYFEWNDQIAAEEHRLGQARQMVYSIRVRYVEPGEVAERRQIEVRTPEPRSNDVVRQLRPQTSVKVDPAVATRHQMLRDAWDSMVIWHRRFAPHFALAVNAPGDLLTEASLCKRISDAVGKVIAGEVVAPTAERRACTRCGARFQPQASVQKLCDSCLEKYPSAKAAIKEAKAER